NDLRRLGFQPTIGSNDPLPGASDRKTAAGIGFARSGTSVRGKIGQFEILPTQTDRFFMK
ncbi:MAG: hypothetical protein V1790_15595, partial [Planctomycetota bacterium]